MTEQAHPELSSLQLDQLTETEAVLKRALGKIGSLKSGQIKKEGALKQMYGDLSAAAFLVHTIGRELGYSMPYKLNTETRADLLELLGRNKGAPQGTLFEGISQRDLEVVIEQRDELYNLLTKAQAELKSIFTRAGEIQGLVGSLKAAPVEPESAPAPAPEPTTSANDRARPRRGKAGTGNIIKVNPTLEKQIIEAAAILKRQYIGRMGAMFDEIGISGQCISNWLGKAGVSKNVTTGTLEVLSSATGIPYSFWHIQGGENAG